jgi:hypothetical protein
MGLGAVHCVVNGTRYKQSQRTTAGAEKWLDVEVHTSTEACLGGLKRAGYQIVVTHLGPDSIAIQVGARCVGLLFVRLVAASAATESPL